MHHLYIQLHSDVLALRKEREALLEWCKNNNITQYVWLEDSLTGKRASSRRIRLLLSNISEGDTIVASKLSRLGRSLPMFSEVMDRLRDKASTVITIDGRTMIPGPEFDDFTDKLSEIVAIEKEIKNFRSNEVLYDKREEGVSLGRPRGALKAENKKVLYGKTERLEQLYAAGMSINNIAKDLKESRGTIDNYLKAK